MVIVAMFKVQTILALSAAILFVPTKALAEWMYVSPSTSGERVEIETDSVEYQSPDVFYLLRSTENAPNYTGYYKTTIHSSINCSRRTGRIHRMTGFNKSGRVIFDYSKTSQPTGIMPGTPSAKLYNQLCP
jgi:hypothetical protein